MSNAAYSGDLVIPSNELFDIKTPKAMKPLPEKFLRQIENRFGVDIDWNERQKNYTISSSPKYADHFSDDAREVIVTINQYAQSVRNREYSTNLVSNRMNEILSRYHSRAQKISNTPDAVSPFATASADENSSQASPAANSGLSAEARKLIARIQLPHIEARTENQRKFRDKMMTNDITFAIAPAGTGKTFLAVDAALRLLVSGKVERIVITRPAKTSDEDHGFLPGDIGNKMDPYLKPIYKSLMKLVANGDTLKGKELLRSLMATEIVEISPLAYMRGNEFDKAAIVGDEFQNATHEQTKMLMTRLGEGGYMIIVGDPEQTDITPASNSGLLHAAEAFEKARIPGIAVARMDVTDAVRHRLMGPILDVFKKNPPPVTPTPV